MKNNFLNKFGFTLVEIIVSIVIIGIIAILLVPLFSNNILRIHNSGQKSEALYTSQQDIEQVVAGQTMPAEMSVAQADQTITIWIKGTRTDVLGDLLQSQIEYGTNDQNTLIYYFKVK